uniref:Uncharacterized protein n=1 Tax=Arundo donax TaxID=35708 RepID=A0A0A9A6H8_ARUDO
MELPSQPLRRGRPRLRGVGVSHDFGACFHPMEDVAIAYGTLLILRQCFTMSWRPTTC